MARHKEFDKDIAVTRAIRLFAEKGYEGTSTDELLRGMGISRQSMYDTFGDKRGLYLAALDRYNTESIDKLIADVAGNGSPAERIALALQAFVKRSIEEDNRCCLGVGAIAEFGRSDTDVTAATDRSSRRMAAALARLLEVGKAEASFATDLDVPVAVDFLGVTLSGMKIAARNGASPETLNDIARMALRSLR